MKFKELFRIGPITSTGGKGTYLTSGDSKIVNASKDDDQLELTLVNDSGQHATTVIWINEKYKDISQDLLNRLFRSTKEITGFTLDELQEHHFNISVHSIGDKLMIDNS